MITLKYSEFMNFGFAQAFQKLASTPFPSNVAYRIKKIGDEINRYREPVRKEFQAVLEQFAEKNKEGKFEHPDGENSFDIKPEKMDAFKAAEKVVGDKEMTISRLPLKSTDLGNLQLTAGEILSLAGLVVYDDPEEAKEVATVTPIKSGA